MNIIQNGKNVMYENAAVGIVRSTVLNLDGDHCKWLGQQFRKPSSIRRARGHFLLATGIKKI